MPLDIQKFLNRKGEVTNYKQALPTLLRLAERGDVFAQNVVGFCFDTGSGTPQDTSKAIHWYEKAAKGGSKEAIGNLAAIFENGTGVNPDLRRAHRLYRRGPGGCIGTMRLPLLILTSSFATACPLLVFLTP